MTALVYRNAGAWGAGKGAMLTSLEVDTNIYNLDQGKADKFQTGKITAVESANLLLNSTGEFGNLNWGTSNFAGASDASSASGALFSLASALTGSAASVEDVSGYIPVGAGVILNLQAEVFAGPMTAGRAFCKIDFYDSSQTYIGGSNAILTSTVGPGAGWTFIYGNGTSPANTAYCRVHKVADTNPAAPIGGIKFRRIKLEGGALGYSTYSNEADWLYLIGAPAFTGRPLFAGNTPWDTGNFNPANYLQLTGGTMSGAITCAGLTVNSTGTIGPGLYMSSNNGGYKTYLRANSTNSKTELVNNGNNAINFDMTENGDASIRNSLTVGQTTNINKLSVNYYGPGYGAGISMRANVDGATAVVFNNASVSVVGSITTTSSATAFNTSSDYRIKSDYKAIDGALASICRVKMYNGKINGVDGQEYGLAHEIAQEFPFAVTGEKDALGDWYPVYRDGYNPNPRVEQVAVPVYEEDGVTQAKNEDGSLKTEFVPMTIYPDPQPGDVIDMKQDMILQAVDYSKLIPRMIAAMQEMAAEIAALKAAATP